MGQGPQEDPTGPWELRSRPRRTGSGRPVSQDSTAVGSPLLEQGSRVTWPEPGPALPTKRQAGEEGAFTPDKKYPGSLVRVPAV